MLILVFLLCAGCGGVYVLDLSARRRQIRQMQDLIRYLRREIRCSGAPLHRILSSEQCPSDLPILREMELAEPFDLIASYENSKRSCNAEMFFTEEEWSASDHLFYALGQGDFVEQESRLSLAESAFSEAEKNAQKTMERNGKPAIVLGCSLGAVFVLMLI